MTFRRKLINFAAHYNQFGVAMISSFVRIAIKRRGEKKRFRQVLESTKTKETEEAATAADEAKRDKRGKSVTFTIHHKRWSKEEMLVAKAKGATEREREQRRINNNNENDMQ